MWNSPKYIALKDPALSLAVYDTGNAHSETQALKPVLFMVHGLGLNALLWKYAVEHLRSDFRCIAIDLPGHGHSWEQKGNFSMTFYAQCVRACIEAMGLKEITLAGHSMGGQVSIITALQMPAVVQRLVLVSAAGLETFTKEEAAQIIQGTEYFYSTPSDMTRILSLYTPHFSSNAERVRELADDHITQNKERFSAHREMIIASVKGMLNEPVTSFLPHIHQPTLLIYGQNDQLIPNKWVHPMQSLRQLTDNAVQKIMHAQVKLIPGCGHYLPFEQPKTFAEDVQRFLITND